MMIRQPIVSVLGHVDHGKTTFLDKIRGTAIADKEAGRITQHIGATEVPVETIYSICGDMLKGRKFKIPGMLFIDTPGHYSFTTLRARGGALADLAVLIVDINEGFKPQTLESINILRRYKTPFVVAANKIDLIDGWIAHPNECFTNTLERQRESVANELEEKLYQIIGKLYDNKFPSERYDRVDDFRRSIAIVPISAKTGEGIQDLLMILIGLAQKFLEERLEVEEGLGEGTILEIKEEKGLGQTIDAIIYNGKIRQGDKIVVGTIDEPIITKVKALLKPKPLDEIRDPTERFRSVKEVGAAAGIKIAAPNLEGVIAGAPLKVVKDNLESVIKSIQTELQLSIETADIGIIIKADAIGSLEALCYELREKGILIKKAEVGDVSRRDVIDASTVSDRLFRAILAFNVKILPDAESALQGSEVALFSSEVIYKLIEQYEEWSERRREELEKERRERITHPGMLKILRGCIFRTSKPAIFGVRVLAGRIKVDQSLMREDGRVIGRIKSIRSVEESFKEANAGQEVAIAMDNVTVGRQIKEEDILYVDIPEGHAKKLSELDLRYDERDVLEKVTEIKRKEKPFWGM